MRISFSVSLSVILPYGRVILLSPDNSVIESCGFSVILFALKLAKRITLCEAQYHCEAIKLALWRIKLALYPYGYNALRWHFLYNSLVEHCLCNSLEACDVCACNKVVAETVFLCAFSGNVVDVLHDVVKLIVNLFS